MEKEYTLNNGVKMPKLGLGTFRMSPRAAQKAVEVALSDGYHLIDTAEAITTNRALVGPSRIPVLSAKISLSARNCGPLLMTIHKRSTRPWIV